MDLIKAGFLDDVSLAMMVHAGSADVVGGSSLAMSMWDVVLDQLRLIQDKVRRCLEAGAHASDCTMQLKSKGNDYAELVQDPFLSGAYQEAMNATGRDVVFNTDPVASTDMGNVSQVVPAIRPIVGYDVRGAVHHTAEFAAFGASAGADKAVLDGSFGMAAAACAAAMDAEQRKRLLHKALG